MSTTSPLHFELPTAATAPEASRPILAQVQSAWGFTPNLIRLFANSPAALQGVWSILGAFEHATLTPAQRQVVLLAASVENDCHYCTAAHTTMGAGVGVTKDQLAAIRDDSTVGDVKIEALRHFTKVLVSKRGFAGEAEVQAFLAAGYTKEQVLEVVLGVAAKTLTNYTNHLAGTPVDDAFKANVFVPKIKAAA